MNSGEQEQEGASLTTLHSEFGPHGEGSHGFCDTTGSGAKSARVSYDRLEKFGRSVK